MTVSGGTGYWYYKGTFYNFPDTHVNFLVENPELLGLDKEVVNSITKGDTKIDDFDERREELVTMALKKGAIRIRFYRDGRTSVQCYDIKKNRKDLVECLMDGYNKQFGQILTVLDCFGWGECLNDISARYGMGKGIKDFINESKINHTPNYKQVLYEDLKKFKNIYKESNTLS